MTTTTPGTPNRGDSAVKTTIPMKTKNIVTRVMVVPAVDVSEIVVAGSHPGKAANYSAREGFAVKGVASYASGVYGASTSFSHIAVLTAPCIPRRCL